MTYIMLPAILRISGFYFVYFLKVLSFVTYRVFIKAAYRQTMVGVPVVARVPQFEKPCCSESILRKNIYSSGY